jgi:hypothetical protein
VAPELGAEAPETRGSIDVMDADVIVVGAGLS